MSKTTNSAKIPQKPVENQETTKLTRRQQILTIIISILCLLWLFRIVFTHQISWIDAVIVALFLFCATPNIKLIADKLTHDANLSTKTIATLLACCTTISIIWPLTMTLSMLNLINISGIFYVIISLVLFGGGIYLRHSLPPEYLAKHSFLHKSSLVGSVLCLIPGALIVFIIVLLFVTIALSGNLPTPT